MNRRVVSIALGFAAMCLAAYAFGRLTRTEWVWWLAPITVALDGSRLFRSSAYGSAVPLSLSELRLANDAVTSVYAMSAARARARRRRHHAPRGVGRP